MTTHMGIDPGTGAHLIEIHSKNGRGHTIKQWRYVTPGTPLIGVLLEIPTAYQFITWSGAEEVIVPIDDTLETTLLLLGM